MKYIKEYKETPDYKSDIEDILLPLTDKEIRVEIYKDKNRWNNIEFNITIVKYNSSPISDPDQFKLTSHIYNELPSIIKRLQNIGEITDFYDGNLDSDGEPVEYSLIEIKLQIK